MTPWGLTIKYFEFSMNFSFSYFLMDEKTQGDFMSIVTLGLVLRNWVDMVELMDVVRVHTHGQESLYSGRLKLVKLEGD